MAASAVPRTEPARTQVVGPACRGDVDGSESATQSRGSRLDAVAGLAGTAFADIRSQGGRSPAGRGPEGSRDDVLELTEVRSNGRGEDVDPVVKDRFERINRSATMAVARWMAGEGAEVAIEAGRETWIIYGELAAHRAASLNQLTKRCVWWRDSVVQVLQESADAAGRLARGALAGARRSSS